MKKLRSSFITGLLVLVPVYVTFEVFLWAIGGIDRALSHYFPQRIQVIHFPGMGFLLVLLLVLVTGVLTQNFVGKWLVEQLDLFVGRFPVLGGFYGAVKEFLSTLFNPASDKFKKAVLVSFPKEGYYMIGFLTGEPHPALLPSLQGKWKNVFIPLTPNPTSGYYLIIEEKDLTPLEMSVHEAFKVMISVGIVSEEERAKVLKKKGSPL